MDFVSDLLFDCQSFRILTVVDRHTRGALSTALKADFRANRVVEALGDIVRARGRPKSRWWKMSRS